MYILSDKSTGGVYAVFNKDKVKTVQLFEEEDDATRYQELLAAEGYEDDLEIVEVDLNTVAINCDNYGYFYSVITKDDFVIPPK
jgi:sulfur carrier protein ThiS